MFRQFMAPLLGAAALLVAFYGLGATAPVAIVIGLLVWAGFWFLGWRRGAGAPLLRRPRAANAELMEAASRLETIRAASLIVRAPSQQVLLVKIVDVASAMLEEAFADASKRRRYRKALGHHLWHVEALSTRVLGLEQAGTPDPTVMERTTELLGKLHRAIDQARRQSIVSDEEDLDVRLTVIEREMDAQLGVSSQNRRAAGP